MDKKVKDLKDFKDLKDSKNKEDFKEIRVYNENVEIINIKINKTDDSNIKIKILDQYGYLFLNEKSTIDNVNEFLFSRVFPNRNDKSVKDALNELNLKEYNIDDIIRKTKGKMLHDNISIVILN